MNLLDQTDIDALLANATEYPEPPPSRTQPTPGAVPPPTARRDWSLPSEFSLEADAATLQRLLPIKVPVTVRLAERMMSVEHILDLSVGSIIEFEKFADSDLDLLVNNVPIGRGNAVKCGEHFALRVIRVEPWMHRLIAAGLYR